MLSLDFLQLKGPVSLGWGNGPHFVFKTLMLRHGMSQHFPLSAFIGACWRLGPCDVRPGAVRRVAPVKNRNRSGFF